MLPRRRATHLPCCALCARPVAQELSGGPPAGFTLTESKGDTLMSLSKDFRGEKVAVDIMVNDQVRSLHGECNAVQLVKLPPGSMRLDGSGSRGSREMRAAAACLRHAPLSHHVAT